MWKTGKDEDCAVVSMRDPAVGSTDYAVQARGGCATEESLVVEVVGGGRLGVGVGIWFGGGELLVGLGEAAKGECAARGAG